jgi:hypothetical protein
LIPISGLMLASALNAQAPADHRNFVSCPIVQDTKTQPCWLAEYNGETYYLGQQGGVAQDFYPGQQMHELLVEGTVVNSPRVCGGIPLRPVKISVMPNINPACTVILPAVDGIEAPPPPPSPTPGLGPSWVKVDSPTQTTIYFDFDNDFLSFHSLTTLSKIAEQVKQSQTQVDVTGYRAASLLSNGKTLTEAANMASVRAEKVAGILIGLGIPKQSVLVKAPTDAAKADGINDAWNRRVVIRTGK